MPSATTSRSPSKRKLVHSSPVPASVETTPEQVPHKKNKTSSSQKALALLPAVSITSRQTRPSRGRLTLKRKVSYGELSAEEIEGVIVPSDVDDAELSSHSIKHRGHVLFVDDKASEASRVSEEPSDSEGYNGADCDAESNGSAVIQSSCSLRLKVKTVKGSYVDELLRSGNVDDVVESDDLKKDPTLTSSKDGHKRSPSPVYLEDLEFVAPKLRSKGKTSVKGGSAVGCRTPAKPKKGDLLNNARLDVDVSVDAATSTLVKTVGLSSMKARGSRSAPCQGRSAGKAEHEVFDDIANPLADTAPPMTVQPKTTSTRSASIKATNGSSTAGCGSAGTRASRISASKPSKMPCSQAKPVSTSIKSDEPLFLPSGIISLFFVSALTTPLSDEDDDHSGSAMAPGSQITNDLAVLLGRLSLITLPLCCCLPESNRYMPLVPAESFLLSYGFAVLLLPSLDLDLSEPDDPALRIMQPALMEEHLVTLGVYSLPAVAWVHIVTGFAPDTFDPPRFFSFADAAKLFQLDSLISLVEGFKFDCYGSFVNLARTCPSALSLEGKSLHVGGSNVVCMTVGIVMECMLFEPAHQGGYAGASGTQGGKHVKCLKIMPFHQMFQCESTTWALVFDLEFVETPCISNQGVSFPTRVEDPSGRSNKNSKLPVYDGRASAGNHFLFHPSDFAMLKSLPRFMTSRDLDVFSLVSVGYSLSVWTAFNNEPRVSPNILFAIVLGTAPKKETLVALGHLD
ncbi:hypothetical protein IW261DRAFT_1566572 [Armillaria novae-zelandiae]|uniref:Uncharacterized protein n=1 Tax=Armillaria novae-zelandiae TaxID=153914 RepID=A0AA39TB19_9AGAR|nr:hypothetical protein IW261DRAFT_1566572 [Armillaria novae-zelandiae]